ncbi:MAG: PKD domain-containing protein, partial [Saprospiraceae bacterium]|nr:PKD domain-containing protein [Saprospiraceae bacterium]
MPGLSRKRSFLHLLIIIFIDLQFFARSGTDKPIEYNFIVHPGANPAAIQLRYTGAENISIVDGNIKIDVRHGSLIESIPASWLDDKAQMVDVSYKQIGNGVFRFDVPQYDASKTLTIDPTPQLLFGTFVSVNPLYSSSGFYLRNIRADQSGNVYTSIVVNGMHTNISTTGTSYNESDGVNWALLKFGPKGQLLAATYFGGTRDEYSNMIELTDDGLFFMGQTNSANLQTSGRASYQSCNAYTTTYTFGTFTFTVTTYRSDVMMAKFSTSLTRTWSQYVAGCYNDGPVYTDLMSDGSLLAMMYSGSSDFPLSSGSIVNDYGKYVIGKYDGNGTRVFAKVTDSQKLTRISTTSDGGFVLGGDIYTSDPEYAWPALTPSVYKKTVSDSYQTSLIARYNSSGVRQWATFLQDGNTTMLDLDVDGQDNIFVFQKVESRNGATGPKSATDYLFTTTPGAYQESIPQSYQTFFANNTSFYGSLPALAKLSADGSQYLMGTWVLPAAFTQTQLYYYVNNISGPTNRKMVVDPASGDVFLAGGYNGMVVTEGAVTPCAQSLEANSWFARMNGSTGQKVWQTTWGLNRTDIASTDGNNGSYPMTMEYKNGKLYFGMYIDYYNNSSTDFEYDPARDEALTTAGAWKRTTITENDGRNRSIYLGSFEEFQGVPPGLILTPSEISPLTQEACVNGLPKTIKGNQVKIQQPLDAKIALLYQWQSADQLTGPWTNISGAKSRNYTPRPIVTGPKYFRRLVQTLNENCMIQTIDSSAVAAVTLRVDIAPNADIDGSRYFLCPGNSITLDGSASGGSGTGYQYAWYVGGDTISSGTGTSFTHAPTATTVYTMRVTDSAGCFDIDQVAVEPVKSNAGPDVAFCEGSTGVQIGGAPIQGTTLIAYTWDASNSLSCTDCPQSVANVSANTSFYLTTTVTRKDGSTCSTRDTTLVSLVTIPRVAGDPNFAGPDKAVCFTTSTSIGSSSVSGYTYK